ncbi:PIG-L family deacetylase [candidate division NPL-UPA2 bacterium]|nr:PIG-L family deacetylase [candidate division NPL-UPA2 bacterium]
MIVQPQNSTKKVLVFSAHPDDHLCCAGTLMFLKDKGFEILEIVATGGEKGPWWVSKIEKKKVFDKKELEKVRKGEISKASRIIDVSQTTFLGLPDSKIIRDLEAIEEIVSIIRKEKPEIVFTHNQKDYHCDHRELSKIVLEALEKASWHYLPEKGEPWRVPIVLLMEGFYFGKAYLVVDITSYLERKNKLIDVYQSQINPRERKLLESMNFYRAFLTRNEKTRAAEAFEIPEEFPIYFNRMIEVFKS